MDFEIYAHAIMLSDHEGKILLCKNEERNFYYLPGTKVESGKSVVDSLKDYLLLEHNIKPKNFYFQGMVENIYKGDQAEHHQFNLVFKIDDGYKSPTYPKSKLVFEWVSLPLPENVKFEPSYLKKDIIIWLRGEGLYLSTKEKPFYS